MSRDRKRDNERKKKEKKQKDWLEAYIFSILEKSIYKAGMAALDDLFRDWK